MIMYTGFFTLPGMEGAVCEEIDVQARSYGAAETAIKRLAEIDYDPALQLVGIEQRSGWFL